MLQSKLWFQGGFTIWSFIGVDHQLYLKPYLNIFPLSHEPRSIYLSGRAYRLPKQCSIKAFCSWLMNLGNLLFANTF